MVKVFLAKATFILNIPFSGNKIKFKKKRKPFTFELKREYFPLKTYLFLIQTSPIRHKHSKVENTKYDMET